MNRCMGRGEAFLFSYRCAARSSIGLWSYVEFMDQQVICREVLESYRVLDVSDQSMNVKVILNPGHGMNYHSHEKRDEVWMVVSGSERVEIDGDFREVKVGSVL